MLTRTTIRLAFTKTFTAGNLAGLAVRDSMQMPDLAMALREAAALEGFRCEKPLGGSPYRVSNCAVETVTEHFPRV